ncbi:MAG: hypothetical protein ACMUEM_01235 [Flavobacteriales bacterium AspAUS03]
MPSDLADIGGAEVDISLLILESIFQYKLSVNHIAGCDIYSSLGLPVECDL